MLNNFGAYFITVALAIYFYHMIHSTDPTTIKLVYTVVALNCT